MMNSPNKKLIFFVPLVCLFLGGVFSESLPKSSLGARLTIDAARQDAVVSQILENQSALIDIQGDAQFLNGIEIELTASHGLPSSGAFSLSIYGDMRDGGAPSEWEVRQFYTETLTDKITNIYQIALHPSPALRRSPYITIVPDHIEGASFPLLLKISASGKTEEPLQFRIRARPLFGEVGALKLSLRYPPGMQGKEVSVLIDDDVVDINALQMLREGEHGLLLVSEDFRTESRRFLIERGRMLELIIALKDTTPTLLFEAPDMALVFVNNRRVLNPHSPYTVNPGTYDIKIQVSDYTIIKTVQVQRGKTYRIAFTVDISVSETD